MLEVRIVRSVRAASKVIVVSTSSVIAWRGSIQSQVVLIAISIATGHTETLRPDLCRVKALIEAELGRARAWCVDSRALVDFLFRVDRELLSTRICVQVAAIALRMSPLA